MKKSIEPIANCVRTALSAAAGIWQFSRQFWPAGRRDHVSRSEVTQIPLRQSRRRRERVHASASDKQAFVEKMAISLPLLNRSLNIILILAIALAVLFETYLLANKIPLRAQESGQSGGSEQLVAETPKCVEHVKAFMEKRSEEFGKFMNEHFRSAKPTSELIDAAMERYREYKNAAYKEIDDFFPAGRASTVVAASERPRCEEAAEENFKIMREMIRQHVVENAYAKKTTKLLDKYKTINAKLEKLNFNIAQMYGYFGALSQKLPCYAKKCIKS